MVSNGCASLTLDSQRGLVFQGSNGEEWPASASFDAGQIMQILAEAAPPEHRFKASGAYVFEEEVEGTRCEVFVTHQNGQPTVRVAVVERVEVPAPAPIGPVTTQAKGEPPAPPVPSPVAARTSAPTLAEMVSLPAEAPFLLRLSDKGERVVTAVLGMSLGLAVSALLAWKTRRGSILNQMFDPHQVTSAVPVLISCFFFWASFICMFRWLRLRKVEVLSPTSWLAGIARHVESAGPAATAEELQGVSVVGATPLLRRCAAVLRQWAVRPSLQNADIVLKQHVAHDEEAVHRGYNLVRTFVWALPVLGLIGTVVGIALAVGGFASFLGGDIDDVRAVKRNLVGVTGGLSFAFLITLQGLLTSLVVMLVSSGLQTREDRLYGRIQHAIGEILLPVLQRVVPESAAPSQSTSGGEVWATAAPRILEAIEKATRDTIDVRERERREDIVRFTQAVTGASKEISGQAETIREAASALGGLMATTQSVMAQQSSLQTSLRAAADSMTTLSTAVSALQNGATGLQQSMHQVGAALERWDGGSMSQTMASVRTSLENLAPILQSFRGPFVFQAVPVDGGKRIDGHPLRG
jgi:hypothetical protein